VRTGEINNGDYDLNNLKKNLMFKDKVFFGYKQGKK
jgi:hypothetical protein